LCDGTLVKQPIETIEYTHEPYEVERYVLGMKQEHEHGESPARKTWDIISDHTAALEKFPGTSRDISQARRVTSPVEIQAFRRITAPDPEIAFLNLEVWDRDFQAGAELVLKRAFITSANSFKLLSRVDSLGEATYWKFMLDCLLLSIYLPQICT